MAILAMFANGRMEGEPIQTTKKRVKISYFLCSFGRTSAA